MKKLTPAQWKMLDRICQSNGGGVFVGFSWSERKAGVIKRLHDMELVQGKRGQPSRAVHTKEGLALWKTTRGTQ